MVISFDRIADEYDRTRSLPKGKMEEVCASLVSELSGCRNILDVGVGTGRFALPLREAGYGVTGIDVSEKMLAKARAKRFEHLVCADARDMPFGDKTFDACLSVHFLHLVSGWRRVLSEMARVARDKYVSLCYENHSKHSDALRREYYSLIEGMGHKRMRPGVGETELMSLVRPDAVVWVTRVTERLVVKRALEGLERRICSSMWEIPEDVHRKAIQTLRETFRQKTTSHSYTMGIVTWKVATLREFLASDAEGASSGKSF